MGHIGKNQCGFKFITLGSTNKVIRLIWGSIPMPGSVIAQVNALGQGQPNDLEFIDRKKRPIGYIYITGVDDWETGAPHIELVEPETDLGPILSGAETLTELAEQQDTTTISE